LLFAGHTHDPALFLLGPSGIPRTVAVQDFVVEPDRRYFVNVGSVGHPRDGDPRASYCIYDTSERAVFWRRVPFDLDAYAAALAQAGLDPAASHLLHDDPRRTRPPLRELLCFSPPRTAAQAAQNAVPEVSIASLRRRVRAWQTATAALVLLATLGGAAAGCAAWRHANRGLYLAPAALPSRNPGPPRTETNLLTMPGTAVQAGQACPGWAIRLGDRRRQSVSVQNDGTTGPVAVMSSAVLDEMSLEAEPCAVRPGQTFHPEAFFQKSPDFAGYVAIVVSLTRDDPRGAGTLSQFCVKEPTQPRQDGWARARKAFTIPARGARIQFEIRGRFRGTVKIRDVSLTRADDKG
jgi:hypothetical protein